MQVIVVYGDPRRSERRLALIGDVPENSIDIKNGFASLYFQNVAITGPVVWGHLDSGAPQLPLVILADDKEPAVNEIGFLTQRGWDLTEDVPVPTTVPFTAYVTLVAPNTNDVIEAYSGQSWFERSLAVTQRATLAISPEKQVAVRVMAVAKRDDGRPDFLLLAEKNPDPDDLRRNGWKLKKEPVEGEIANNWRRMARLCNAVEVQVSYLLGAPLATGAVIHNPDLILPGDLDALPDHVHSEVENALLEKLNSQED